MNEDLFFLNLMVDFSHIAQHTLVQRPVHGTGVESLAPYSDYYIPFCSFDMQLGSMSTISFFFFQNRLRAVQFTLAIILLRIIGAPLSWKKLEFDKTIDWNGWTIHPNTMIAQLPSSKQEKINSLIAAVLQSPSRKNLEKIIGILLWATSLVHHVRFLLTSLYRDLYAIPATNYSINPTEWESFLNLLNDACHHYSTQSPSSPCWLSSR